jgi:hypothetical protein
MTAQLGTPREDVMNITASFPSVMKTRFIVQEEEVKTQEGDAC